MKTSQNQELFLTREQAEQLTVAEAERHLKKLERAYPIDKPFAKLDNFPELWAQMDDITNTILYLEDHIASQKKSDQMVALNEARWGTRGV